VLKRFLPAQTNFFSLFAAAGLELEKAAIQFVDLLHDLNNTKKYAAHIAQHEKEADKIARTTYSLLHSTFITPFDRNDIYHFTGQLDDIMDSLHETSRRIYIYQLKTVPHHITALSQLCLAAAKLIYNAILKLSDLKNMDAIITMCEEICHLENKAEAILLNGLIELFEQEQDIKQLLKLKEVYEQTKKMIDGCEDLANTIKGIVLEYS